MRIYISGPMTGLPDYNYPAFHAAAQRLTDGGHEPVSPTQIGQHPDWTWEDYMQRAIELHVSVGSETKSCINIQQKSV